MDSVAEAMATDLLDRHVLLWGLAILFYGIGDTATTIVGFNAGHVAEAGPVVASFVGHSGIEGLFTIKLLSFAGFYLAWRVLPSPGRLGIPLALVIVGIGVTTWNMLVLLPLSGPS